MGQGRSLKIAKYPLLSNGKVLSRKGIKRAVKSRFCSGLQGAFPGLASISWNFPCIWAETGLARLAPPPTHVRRSSRVCVGIKKHQATSNGYVRWCSRVSFGNWKFCWYFFIERPTRSRKDQHAFDRRKSTIAESDEGAVQSQ
jgi:hypothetical protein